MVTIKQTRGQWTANVSGLGVLPVVASRDLNDEVLTQSWKTRDTKDTGLAQKQFEAVVRQLTAGNPERKIRAVVIDMSDAAAGATKELYEFTLANMNVDRFRNGTARYDYLLTDAQPVN